MLRVGMLLQPLLRPYAKVNPLSRAAGAALKSTYGDRRHESLLQQILFKRELRQQFDPILLNQNLLF